MSRDEEIERVEAILNQIVASGVAEEALLDQMEKFERGIPFTRLARPCTIGDGIHVIEPTEFPELKEAFSEATGNGRVTKFVPASGAASRMFKSLIGYMHGCEGNRDDIADDVKTFGEKFIGSITQFAFYRQLKDVLAENGQRLDALLEAGDHATILKYILTDAGLNYANLPKGLILFHNAEEGARSAFVEHLEEAVNYAMDNNRVARVHFTVPPEFHEAIENHVKQACSRYEQAGIRFDITYSTQKTSSRTLAVDMENNPIRANDELLVFRPAGHGALLENLNDLRGDIIFIKNIDNVVPDHLKPETYTYKQLLGGYLVMLQKKIFAALNRLDDKQVNAEELASVSHFLQKELGGRLPEDYDDYTDSAKREYLFGRLHRPLRVCGMVKNLGEPGGGPFWLTEGEECPLQIVESAQVELDNEDQKKIFDASTHFNPVDLICGVRDHKGQPYNLTRYVDLNLGLISCKSKNGRELKALELPGLWNGSMAYWNTVFVEVPLSTFNPVKTVNDLLREEHQKTL